MLRLLSALFIFGLGLPPGAQAGLSNQVIRNALESLSGVEALRCLSLLKNGDRSVPEFETPILQKLDPLLEHKLLLFHQRGGRFVWDPFREDLLERSPAIATVALTNDKDFVITLTAGFKDPSQLEARELVSRVLQYWFDLEDIAGKISRLGEGTPVTAAREEIWQLYNTFDSEASARLHYVLESRAFAAESAAGLYRKIERLESSYVPTAERVQNEPHRYGDLTMNSGGYPYPELEAIRFLLPPEAEALRRGLLVPDRSFAASMTALKWDLFSPDMIYYMSKLIEKMMKIYELAAHSEAVQLREKYKKTIPPVQIENAKERLRGLFRDLNLPNNTTQFSRSNSAAMNTHIIGPLVLRRYLDTQFKFRADIERAGYLDYLLAQVYQ